MRPRSWSLLFLVQRRDKRAHTRNYREIGVGRGTSRDQKKGPRIPPPPPRPGLQKGWRGDGLTGCRPGLRHTIAKLTQERYWGICLFSRPAKPRGNRVGKETLGCPISHALSRSLALIASVAARKGRRPRRSPFNYRPAAEGRRRRIYRPLIYNSRARFISPQATLKG